MKNIIANDFRNIYYKCNIIKNVYLSEINCLYIKEFNNINNIKYLYNTNNLIINEFYEIINKYICIKIKLINKELELLTNINNINVNNINIYDFRDNISVLNLIDYYNLNVLFIIKEIELFNNLKNTNVNLEKVSLNLYNNLITEKIKFHLKKGNVNE